MNREHLIQVAFSIDEDRIVQSMSDQLRKKLEIEIEKHVKNELYGDTWGYTGLIRDELQEWLKENKEEVLDRTASLLVEKLWRTKAVKDMVKTVGEEVKDDGSV